MAEVLFMAIVTAACSVMIIRQILILAGQWKGPVLHRFSLYSPEEPVIDPLPMLVAWTGATLTALGVLISLAFRFSAWIYLPGLIVLLSAYLMGRRRLDDPGLLTVRLPRWTTQLLETTTREERRHIAYMWLLLPAGTRRAFNSNTPAFLAWTELIVLSTVQQTVYDARLEGASQMRVYRPT